MQPEIGNIQRTFKPGADNLIAGLIIGLLMVGGGLYIEYAAINGVIERGGQLPFWVKKGWCWGTVILANLLGLILLLGGAWLIKFMKTIRSLQVHVGEYGFEVLEGNESTIFLWDNIHSVTETHLYERPPLLSGPAKLVLPEIMSKNYLVQSHGDEVFGFNENSIRHHLELADLIKSQLNGRNIPWEVVEEHS